MKIFSQPALKELALDVGENPEAYRARYLQETPWADDPSFYKDHNGLEVPSDLCDRLIASAKGAADPKEIQVKAAITLHRELIGLTPRQAGNHLLWTRLAHWECWSYMLLAMPVAPASGSDDKEKAKKEEERLRRRILSSYIAESSSRLTRHGLGKLWWFAHISFDPDRGEYKESRIRTLINVKEIIERSYGRCPELMKVVIDFISENEEKAKGDIKFIKRTFHIPGGTSIQPMKTHWRFLLKDFNRLGGVKLLSALEMDEARNFLEESFRMIRGRLREFGPEE